MRGCLAAQLGPKRLREFNLRLLVTTSVSPFGQALTPNIVVNRRKKELCIKLETTCQLFWYGTPGYVIKSVFLRSVAYVSRSGGMSNELNNIISRTTDGVYEGVAIGGDRYPGTTFMDHVMRYQENPDVKMIVVLGEVHFLFALE